MSGQEILSIAVIGVFGMAAMAVIIAFHKLWK